MSTVAWIKRKQHAPTAITDTTFLLIEWGKNFNAKSAEVKAVIEELDQKQLETKRQTLIQKTLPYLTFTNAEALFSKLKVELIDSNQVDEIKFNRVQVCYRAEGQKEAQTKDEIYIAPFILDRNYKGLLKALVEAAFNSKRFKDISYQEKQSYFDDLYLAYSKSTGIDLDLLPIFPTEIEADSGEVQVTFPEVPTSKVPENSVESVEQKIVAPVTSETVTVEPTETLETELTMPEQSEQTKFDEDTEQASEPEVDDTIPSLEELANQPVQPMPQTTVTVPPLKETEPNLELNFGIAEVEDFSKQEPKIKFPRFEEARWSKSFEPHEADYVQWKLDQKRSEFNHDLAQKEEQNQRLATKALNQQLQEFERTELEALNHKYRQLDTRQNLKEEIIGRVQQEQNAKLTGILKNINEAENQALTTLKTKYDQDVANTKSQYEQKRTDTAAELKRQTLDLAKKEYTQAYYDQSASLQRKLDEDLASLAKAKMAKQDEINHQLEAVGEMVGQTYYKQQQAELSKYENQYQKEHDKALKKWLKLKELQESKVTEPKQNTHLETKVAQLESERDNLNQVNYQLKNAVLDEKERSIQEKTQLLKEFQTPVPTAEDKVEVQTPEIPSKGKNAVSIKALVAGTVCLVLAGGTGFGIYQSYQHQNQVVQLSQELRQVKRSNQKLSESQVKTQSDKVKAQKKVDELNKKVSALQKANQASQSSASNSTTNSSVSSDNASQANSQSQTH